MTRLILIAFILVSCALEVGHTQGLRTGNWQLVEGPYGSSLPSTNFDGANFTGLTAATDSSIYVFTNKSTYHSSNRGSTWEDIHPPRLGAGLTSPDDALWLVDNNDSLSGQRWKPGRGWQKVTFPERLPQAAIPGRFLRCLPGHAVYWEHVGKLYRSSDDGQTWSPIACESQRGPSTAPEADFDGKGNAVVCMGSINVAGTAGAYRYFRSVDDGATFSILPSPEMTDYPTGYLAFGRHSELYWYEGLPLYDDRPVFRSDDLFQTRIKIDSNVGGFGVKFGRPFYAQTEMKGYPSSREFFSFDFGKHWDTTFYRLPKDTLNAGYDSNYDSFALLDTSTYLAYGVSRNQLVNAIEIQRTTDHGHHFDTVMRSEQYSFRPNYFVPFRHQVVAVCGKGVYCSKDDGQTWRQTYTLVPLSQITDCEVDSSGVYYLLIQDDNLNITTHRILRSEDGGQHWSKALVTPRVSFTSMAVLHDTLYASYDTSFFRTIDHGQSWQPLWTHPDKQGYVMNGIRTNPVTRHIYLAEDFGGFFTYWMSFNGGVTFTPHAFKQDPIYQFDFMPRVDPRGILWLTGQSTDTVFSSSNEGANWTSHPLPTILRNSRLSLDRLGNLWVSDPATTSPPYNSTRYYFSPDGISWDSCSKDGYNLSTLEVMGDGYVLATDGTNLYLSNVLRIGSVAVRSHPHIRNTSTRLNISPNPASSSITFEPANSEIESEITIVDMAGVTRLSAKLEPQERIVSLAGLSPGIYCVQVAQQGSLQICKLVVEPH